MYRTPGIQLFMTDRDVVERAARMVGNPNIRHRTKEGSKDLFGWSVHGQEAVDNVLLRLFPFMGERRQNQMANMLEVNQRRREGLVYV